SLWHLCCSEVSISPLFRWPNSVNHFNGLVAEGVMYERLVVPLIHHIQKLTERVDELESELKLLSVSRSDIG
ncbi:hypothetical protein R9K25_00155, partial [Escherichia coli]